MGAVRAPQPQVLTIEGRRTLVVHRRPPLPRFLGDLLVHLRVYPIRITGWRADCGAQEHRLRLFAEGRHTGPDGFARDLRLDMCVDCEAVCVRDVSVDRDVDYDPGRGYALHPRLPWRRRNLTLGWYSGTRRGQRTYS